MQQSADIGFPRRFSLSLNKSLLFLFCLVWSWVILKESGISVYSYFMDCQTFTDKLYWKIWDFFPIPFALGHLLLGDPRFSLSHEYNYIEHRNALELSMFLSHNTTESLLVHYEVTIRCAFYSHSVWWVPEIHSSKKEMPFSFTNFFLLNVQHFVSISYKWCAVYEWH